jgi:pyruvate,water dikinase
VRWLRDVSRADVAQVGGKAAALGELAHAGFAVPDGFVVTRNAPEAIVAAARSLPAPWAVRSSAAAEDLEEASFAGQYESFLDVEGHDALLAAIDACRRSALDARVQTYRRGRAVTGDGSMAVLVQQMVRAEVSGVAFTADPISGDRDTVVITAARGLGERVVGGEAIADEWRVRGRVVECARWREQALTRRQARELAALCRRVEHHVGSPQDIEWARAKGRFFILQSRPMTALPPAVRWMPPSAGHWTRTFRIGEWLSEPMTPLFEDWLLERLESGYLVGMARSTGATVPFRHAAVHGWYYTAPPPFPLWAFTKAAVASRGRVFTFIVNALVRVGRAPELADARLLGELARQWKEDILPRYRYAVDGAERAIDDTIPAELVARIDELGLLAGEVLWSLAVVGGSAWKMEGFLTKLLRRHAPAVAGDTAPALLRALPGSDDAMLVRPHAVHSLDWYFPTLGELDAATSPAAAGAPRRAELERARQAAFSTCRDALGVDTRARERFETTLRVAQRYAVLREQQAACLTLAWPVLRRCVRRLGEHARAAQRLDVGDDVFFAKRSELAGRGDLREVVQARRAEWEARRRLVAPLMIGSPSRIFAATVDAFVETVRIGPPSARAELVGHPASPGRAEGAVRVIRGVEDFARFQAGEILVAKGTAPAWTPLFARAAAVVTDGGSLAAHASLVAREYGIPAVVGTENATVRLRDGQKVVVDGSAGIVELA